jgi:hypothetical protein
MPSSNVKKNSEPSATLVMKFIPAFANTFFVLLSVIGSILVFSSIKNKPCLHNCFCAFCLKNMFKFYYLHFLVGCFCLWWIPRIFKGAVQWRSMACLRAGSA